MLTTLLPKYLVKFFDDVKVFKEEASGQLEEELCKHNIPNAKHKTKSPSSKILTRKKRCPTNTRCPTNKRCPTNQRCPTNKRCPTY